MQRLFIFFGALLLLAAPMQAQPLTPTAPPLSPSVVRDLSDAAQVFGPVVIALFLLLIATVALSLLAAWKLWLPTIQANQQANQQIMSMSTQLSQTQVNALNAQTETANAIGRMGVAMADLETRKEAEARQQAIQRNSNTNTETINRHTTDALKPLNDDVAGLRSDFAEFAQYANEILGKLANKDDLAALVNPLKEAIERMEGRLGNIDPAPKTPLSNNSDHPPGKKQEGAP